MTSGVPLGNIDDLLEIVRAERNDMTRDEMRTLRREQPGSFKDKTMTLRVGGRSFKNARLLDINKIKKAYQGSSFVDIAGGAVADATVFAYNLMKQLAERHRVTGGYVASIAVFARTVGGTDKETTLLKVMRQDLPPRPVMTILSDVPYAAKLESITHHGKRLGFLYYVSKLVKREFGKSVDVKFDYIAGARLGRGKAKYLPRLQISNPGDVRGRSKKPKSSR